LLGESFWWWTGSVNLRNSTKVSDYSAVRASKTAAQKNLQETTATTTTTTTEVTNPSILAPKMTKAYLEVSCLKI